MHRTIGYLSKRLVQIRADEGRKVLFTFVYALGYFVPSYEIVTVPPEQLALGPKLAHQRHDLDELLAGRVRQGRVRVSASRIVDGQILGRISFKEYGCCAELRALRPAYAWINDTDAKDHNSLWVWDGRRPLGYLIDFGTSLGGDPVRGPKMACQGWKYDVDIGEAALMLLTLGLHRNGCDPHERPEGPAIGRFSTRFDPRRWKPYAPNLAFEDMTEAEGRWIAGRIMQLSPLQLRAAVEAGQYSDPNDVKRIVEILDARRRRIAEAYPPAMNVVQPMRLDGGMPQDPAHALRPSR